MESLKHENESGARDGSRRVGHELTYRDKFRNVDVVFVVETDTGWCHAMQLVRKWLNDTGRGYFTYSSMRDL